jgi:hypothetical protein
MVNIGIINPVNFPKMEKNSVREDIQYIFNLYVYELMSPKVTNQIANHLSMYFEKEVKDATTDEMRDRGELTFDVLHNDNIYNLYEYIIYLESIERRDKILKIKRNLWKKKRNY